MINIEKCKHLFTKNVEKIDIEKEKISYEFFHAFRVSDNCRMIANSLG